MNRLSVYEKSSETAEAIFNTIYEWRSQELEAAILGELGFPIEFLELWKGKRNYFLALFLIVANNQRKSYSCIQTKNTICKRTLENFVFQTYECNFFFLLFFVPAYNLSVNELSTVTLDELTLILSSSSTNWNFDEIFRRLLQWRSQKVNFNNAPIIC